MNKLYTLLILCTLSTVTIWGQDMPVPSHPPTSGSQVAPAVTPPPDLQKVVARVNGVNITQRDLREQMQRLFPYYAIHGGTVPEKYHAEIRDKAMQQLIDEELIYQAAKKLGMTVPPATMTRMLADARKHFPTQRQYAAYVTAQYGSVAAFEGRIRRGVLIARYQDREIVQKSKVSEAALHKIYDDNKNRFVRPESVSMQTISVNVPENPSPDQLKMIESRINEVLPKAKAAKNQNEFGLLAEKYSEDDYRVMLGDRKWVHLVSLPPAMAKAAAALKPGETSDVLKVPGAWVIIRENDKRPEKQMEFNEVEADVRKQLETSAQQNRWETLRGGLRKNAKIEIL
ncbi:MAG: peptidyl-prolyl cis-trans isomerase [Candidatus Korobacteraceae bacterium]